LKVERLEQRAHPGRHPVQPAFPVSWILSLSPFLHRPEGRWPWPSALPSWRTAGSEGGSGNGWVLWGRWGRRGRATAQRIAVAGERGRRAPFPSK
jgi:hypothetical protein